MRVSVDLQNCTSGFLVFKNLHFREDLNLALDRVVLGCSEDSEFSRLPGALPRLRRPLSLAAASSLVLPLVLPLVSPLLWPLLFPLLWPLVTPLEVGVWARREGLAGDAGGVGLEQCFLATGSGDLKGGECAAWGLFRLYVLEYNRVRKEITKCIKQDSKNRINQWMASNISYILMHKSKFSKTFLNNS